VMTKNVTRQTGVMEQCFSGKQGAECS